MKGKGRRKKGQLEFIVVLGVLVVVVVAAFYVIREADIFQSPVPEGVYDEQRQVAGSINNMIRDAADDTLEDMMSHGGYLGDDSLGFGTYHDLETVRFLNIDVPFWQKCGTRIVPQIDDIEEWMAASIKKMVGDGLDDIEPIYGNRVEFRRAELEVNVDIKGDAPLEPDMAIVTVRLPTVVRNYTMSRDFYPYRAEVDTKFGEIYSFASSFAEASAEDRYFDVYTVGALYFSQIMGDGYPKLPTVEALTECGEVVYRGPNEINEYMLEIAEYVMLTTEWWQPMQPATSGPKVFAIQDLKGNVYGELEPKTRLVDDFEFELHDYVLMTNFDMPSHGGYVIPVCVSTHNHPYEFDYPFVVRTRDPYTGYHFNFASMVSVREGTEPVNGGVPLMVPGDCSGMGIAALECDESALGCAGKVRAVNDLGEPITGASIVYGGCLVGEGGETDGDGFAEGPVKCGPNELSVFHSDEYEIFNEEVSATDLAGTYTVTLNPINEIRFHFREVVMVKEGWDYAEGVGEDQWVSCGICPAGCDIESGSLVRKMSISPVSDNAFAEFRRDSMRLPVTNMDVDTMDDDCMDTDECEFCYVHVDGMESASPQMRSWIQGNCSDCHAGCPFSLENNPAVDYIPSGYAYTVEGNMYSSADSMPVGGFSYDDFVLGRDVEDVYVFIPRRSSDRQYVIDDAERACLTAAMQEFGIEPVSTEGYPAPGAVLMECTCERLRDEAVSCGIDTGYVSSAFCECPEGGSCGMSCGGESGPDCTWCCSTEEIISQIEQSCQTRVICQE
jgi:hypothetical protein